jgi:hypothetical protein
MYRLAGLAWRSPAGFGGFACLLYAILLLPGLALHRFDVSALIMAGDRFVDARQVESPILVHRESNGYDGQFYYRMALAPLSLAPVTGGVRFDHPAWRMQRIFYPVCAWLLAFGRAAAAPWSLMAVNLLGMAAIGWFGRALAVRAGLAGWVPIAILLWPGFIVALTHDTTEILSEALVLAALVCRLRRQAAGCALLGVLAVRRPFAVGCAAKLVAAPHAAGAGCRPRHPGAGADLASFPGKRLGDDAAGPYGGA